MAHVRLGSFRYTNFHPRTRCGAARSSTGRRKISASMGNVPGNRQKAFYEDDRLVSLSRSRPDSKSICGLGGWFSCPSSRPRWKRRESAPIGDEAREQKCGRKRVRVWAPDGEAQRHSRINEKVDRDIEKSASIGVPRRTCNCAIEPISNPVRDQQGQCNVKPSSRGGERSRQP